jgi:hypothetical protein
VTRTHSSRRLPTDLVFGQPVTFLNLAFEPFAAARARSFDFADARLALPRRRGDMRNPGCGGRHINVTETAYE